MKTVRKNADPYLIAVGNRISEYMKKEHLSQQDVLDAAKYKEYNIQQADLSKICSGSASNPRAQTFAQLADILNVSLDDLLSLDVENTSMAGSDNAQLPIRPAASDTIITRPDNPHMKGYLGCYHAYFFPTKSDESEIIKGTIEFKPSEDNKKVIAIFAFKTGKNDSQGNEIVKRYVGELVISTFMYTAYCWLRNDDIGEILYLTFNYTSIAYEELYCRVALVLTSCAGDPRVPTALRMLISKPEITDEDLAIISGQLYLNNREILISELGMKEMLKRKEIQDNEGIQELLQRDGNDLVKLGVMPVLYYRFEETSIRNTYLDSESKLLLINFLRQYASMPRYVKVSKKSDKFLYDFLQLRYNQKQTIKID